MPDHDPANYVSPDEHGAWRVGRARLLLDPVLAAWEQGHSPESIRAQFPALTLEEVYGAIAWCLAHAEEVSVYRQRQEQVWAETRAKAQAARYPVVERLRALQEARARGA